MNKRTFFTLALSIVLLFSASAFAQSAPPAKGHFGGRGHEFAGLNLTVDQKAQIQTIHEEQRTKMEALSNQKLTRAEFRSQAMAIRQEARTKIVNGVLTGEQRAQMQQRQQQRQERFKNRAPISNL